MIDFLYGIDRSVFFFIHLVLRNDILDAVMPFLTNLNQMTGGRVFFIAVGVLLLAVGGRTGRIVVLALVLTITVSDQLSSTLIKSVVQRERPCHVLPDVRPLVDCGSGKSFPSSHAVNMFAAAAVFAYGYRRWTWVFYTLAGVIAFSRVYVGVHYPSDAAGGAVIGVLIGLGMVYIIRYIEKLIPGKRGVEEKKAQ